MDYPAFFEAHIRSVIEQYNAERSKAANGCGFVFITDVHIHLNGRAGVPLIQEIGRCTDVKTVLCGGDHCWAFGSKAQCLADFADSLEYMDPIRDSMTLLHAKGNHDATVRSSWDLDTGYTMPYDQVQHILMEHSSAASGAVKGKTYCYHDDPAAKVRYVILDTSEFHGPEDTAWGIKIGMSDDQLTWLARCALRLPDEQWSVVVMGHVPCVPELPSYSDRLLDLTCILEAFKAKAGCRYGDFTDYPGELVAYLCGHNHKDRHAVHNGILHISTGCDAYCRDDDMSRNVGEPENTLFDLVWIDPERRSLKLFRIGAGKSREFFY